MKRCLLNEDLSPPSSVFTEGDLESFLTIAITVDMFARIAREYRGTNLKVFLKEEHGNVLMLVITPSCLCVLIFFFASIQEFELTSKYCCPIPVPPATTGVAPTTSSGGHRRKSEKHEISLGTILCIRWIVRGGRIDDFVLTVILIFIFGAFNQVRRLEKDYLGIALWSEMHSRQMTIKSIKIHKFYGFLSRLHTCMTCQ